MDVIRSVHVLFSEPEEARLAELGGAARRAAAVSRLFSITFDPEPGPFRFPRSGMLAELAELAFRPPGLVLLSPFRGLGVVLDERVPADGIVFLGAIDPDRLPPGWRECPASLPLRSIIRGCDIARDERIPLLSCWLCPRAWVAPAARVDARPVCPACERSTV